MRENNGITLIALMVTIIVMIILASVAITTGLDSIEQSKVVAFVTEMRIAQGRVNYIYEKILQGQGDEYISKGKPVVSSQENYAQIQTAVNRVNEIDGTNKLPTEFLYFNPNALRKIGIEDVEQDLLINFATRDVISVEGIKRKGEMYYRHFDLRGRS